MNKKTKIAISLIVPTLVATTSATILYTNNNNVSVFDQNQSISNRGTVHVSGQSSYSANNVTVSQLQSIANGVKEDIKNNVNTNVESTSGAQQYIEGVNSVTIRDVNNSNENLTYQGKLTANGKISIHVKKVVNWGGTSYYDKDCDFNNLEFSGFKIWDTAQNTYQMAAPSSLRAYTLVDAKNYANSYAIDHLSEYVSDLPINYKSYVRSGGTEINYDEKSLSVSTTLTKWIDKGNIRTGNKTITVKYTGFDYHNPTRITNIDLNDFGKNRLYSDSMNGDIQTAALAEINRNPNTYNPASSSQVKNLSLIENIDNQAKGIYKFNANLSPYYADNGGITSGNYPFTVTVRGFKKWNTDVVATTSTTFDSKLTNFTADVVGENDIKDKILSLVRNGSIFNGQIRTKTLSSLTNDDIIIHIAHRDPKTRSIDVDVDLKSPYVWNQGNPTSSNLRATFKLNGFKKSVASLTGVTIGGTTTIYEGQSTTLTANPTVDINNSTASDYKYQWYWYNGSKPGEKIPNGDQKTITITPDISKNNWKVYCKVTLNGETMDSTDVTLTINANNVNKVTYTATTNVNEGANITATAEVSMLYGTTDYSKLSFKWYIKDKSSSVLTQIPGQTTRNLTAAAQASWDGDALVCGVSYGSNPEIQASLQQSISVNKNVISTINVTGNTTVTEGKPIDLNSSVKMSLFDVPSDQITYQWYKSKSDGSGETPISGEIRSSINFIASMQDDTKLIYLKASYNGVEKVSNKLPMVVTPKPLPTISSVKISGNTSGLTDESTLSLSSSIFMSEGPVPDSGLTYNWIIKSGAEELSIGTEKDLNVACNSSWNGKQLILRVTYNGNHTDSDPIQLNIKAIPKITNLEISGSTAAQVGTTITIDSILSMNITDIGSQPITYQWYMSDTDGRNEQILTDKTQKDISLTAKKELNDKQIYLRATLNGNVTTSNKLGFNVSDRPLPTISTVKITGKYTGLAENELMTLDGEVRMSDGTTNPSGASYVWKINNNGSWDVVSRTKQFTTPASALYNGKQLVLEVTYDGKMTKSNIVTLGVNEKTKLLAVRITGNSTVQVGKELIVTSELISNIGSIPTNNVTYEWFFKDGNSYTKINDSTTDTLKLNGSWNIDGKTIVLKATYDSVVKESNELKISVVTTPVPDVPADKPTVPENGSGGSSAPSTPSNPSESADDGNIMNKEILGLNLLYWIIIAAGTVVLLIIIIVIISISKKKKAKANKKKVAARVATPGKAPGLIAAPTRTAPGSVPPKPTGAIPTKTQGVPPKAPTAPGAIPTKTQGVPPKPGVQPQRPAVPTAKPGTVPVARPGANIQRPGVQKPNTPPPPKVEIKAPPSYAPKKK